MKQFDVLSNLKINLDRNTELLEACDLDEKQAEFLLNALADCIKLVQQEPKMIESYSEFEDQIAESLSNEISVYQSLVLMKILKDSLDIANVQKKDNN